MVEGWLKNIKFNSLHGYNMWSLFLCSLWYDWNISKTRMKLDFLPHQARRQEELWRLCSWNLALIKCFNMKKEILWLGVDPSKHVFIDTPRAWTGTLLSPMYANGCQVATSRVIWFKETSAFDLDHAVSWSRDRRISSKNCSSLIQSLTRQNKHFRCSSYLRIVLGLDCLRQFLCKKGLDVPTVLNTKSWFFFNSG